MKFEEHEQANLIRWAKKTLKREKRKKESVRKFKKGSGINLIYKVKKEIIKIKT